ncbi:MAG: hypothetical protein HKN11_03835 [Rhizobiales bacterium]|nr:hypothetical protein [Hyphomicrobiales bacterium]
MSKLPQTDSAHPHGKIPVFPSDIDRRIRELSRWDPGAGDDIDIPDLVEKMSQLRPAKVLQVGEEISRLGGVFDFGHYHGGTVDAFRTHPKQVVLQNTECLEFLFLFHSNGYLREAALKKLNRPLPGPLFVAAVAYRLNDWVEEVRVAAKGCLARVLPRTDSQAIAEAGIYLIHQMWLWRRAGDHVTALVNELSKPEIMAALAQILSRETTGPLARTLRNALRFETMDRHLEMLAQEALSPAVRAVAIEALIDGRARWLDGHQQEWIDKSMSLYRRVPRYSYRPLTIDTETEPQIRRAAVDRVSIVRKLAAQKLIEHRHKLPPMDDVAHNLEDDRSPAVRERANFYLLKMDLQ